MNEQPAQCQGNDARSIENIARICHETNRAWCLALGDTSQPLWENAPEWQRESALKGVFFHLAHPDATASASHDQWLAEKRATGWTFGAVKDPEKKEHPCFVPFELLPWEQQMKDKLFKSIVDVLR
jgi:hypothetical protein